MSESDKSKEPETKGKVEKKPKRVDLAAQLLDQWRLLTEASAQSELSLDDVRRFIAKVHVAIKGKFKLIDLPTELTNMLSSRERSENQQGENAVRVAEKPLANESKSSHHGPEDPPAAPTVAPHTVVPPTPQPQIAKQALSAELKKAFEEVGGKVDSIDNRLNSSIRAIESRIMEAITRQEASLAALRSHLTPERLADQVRSQVELLDDRMRRLEKVLGEAIARLETSFSLADAKQVIALRIELEKDIGPNILSKLSEQIAPLLQTFDHLADANELTPEKMRALVSTLRDRANRAGLTLG